MLFQRNNGLKFSTSDRSRHNRGYRRVPDLAGMADNRLSLADNGLVSVRVEDDDALRAQHAKVELFAAFRRLQLGVVHLLADSRFDSAARLRIVAIQTAFRSLITLYNTFALTETCFRHHLLGRLFRLLRYGAFVVANAL